MTRYMKIKDTDITSDKSFINPESEKITVGVYFHFDEEIGYVLDEDAMMESYEEQIEKFRENISETNHARDEHLAGKHAEWDNPPANYEGEK